MQVVTSGNGTGVRAASLRGELCRTGTPLELGVPAFERSAGAWWVLHTRSRHEKAVADALDRQRIPYYLPLVRAEHRYGRRRVSNAIPLFPGYLFLRGGSRECDAAWKTNRIANVLPVSDQEKIDLELRQIRHVIESGVPVDLYPSLRPGRRCRIMGGSLSGIEGIVMRRRSVSRVYIAVTFLGQSAVIEIDTALVEAID